MIGLCNTYVSSRIKVFGWPHSCPVCIRKSSLSITLLYVALSIILSIIIRALSYELSLSLIIMEEVQPVWEDFTLFKRNRGQLAWLACFSHDNKLLAL